MCKQNRMKCGILGVVVFINLPSVFGTGLHILSDPWTIPFILSSHWSVQQTTDGSNTDLHGNFQKESGFRGAKVERSEVTAGPDVYLVMFPFHISISPSFPQAPSLPLRTFVGVCVGGLGGGIRIRWG